MQGCERLHSWIAACEFVCSQSWQSSALWLLHLVLLLLQGKKQKPSKGGSVPLPSFKRWRNDEISRFQTQLVQLGAGRLEDVKREVSRWCVCCMGIQHSLSHKSHSL